MKPIITAIALTAGLSFSAAAQDFKAPLQSTFTSFDTTWNPQAKMEAGNKLTLIAKKWPDQWQTQYYAAYSRVQLSYLETDAAKRDAYVDEAQTYYDETVRLSGKETDETHVLAAMIAQARMAVDGRNRYQKYGKIFEEQLDEAKKINPDNPRIYYLRGTAKFYTPKMFGGGKKAAAPFFEKANELFAKQTGMDDIGNITWGKMQTDYYLSGKAGEEKE